jgi:hypothetical protein
MNDADERRRIVTRREAEHDCVAKGDRRKNPGLGNGHASALSFDQRGRTAAELLDA